MQFFKQTTNFDFMGVRRACLIMSGVACGLSIVAALVIGPRFGIDFMGGTEIQVVFQQRVESADVRQAMDELGFKGSEVVTFGSHESEYLLRLQSISPVSDALAQSSENAFKGRFPDTEVSKFEFSPGGDKLTIRLSKEVPIADLEKTVEDSGLSLGSAEQEAPKVAAQEENEEKDSESGETESAKSCQSVTCTWPHQDAHIYEVNLKGVAEHVMEGLRARSFGKGALKMRSEWVGPKVGRQLRTAGVSSIAYALLFIMLYIAVRFDLRFAPGAVVALIHDVVITVGVFTLARVEVTLATVAALLTIVGYSLNDTIVVFDRIRENLVKIKERDLVQVINSSVNQTLSRTILTSLTTLIVVVVLLGVGWNTTIRDFAFALFVGVIVGTYSSVFIASPIVVWLDQKFAKKKA
jgi:preprotein translocase subunit SecF